MIALQPWKLVTERARSADTLSEPVDKSRSIFKSAAKKRPVSKDMITLVRATTPPSPFPTLRSTIDPPSPRRFPVDDDICVEQEPEVDDEELEIVFNALFCFVMQNSGKPLPPQYHSNLLRIMEAFRNAKGRIDKANAELAKERQARHALQWELDRQQINSRLEKADYEAELKKLTDQKAALDGCALCSGAAKASTVPHDDSPGRSSSSPTSSAESSDQSGNGHRRHRPNEKKRRKKGHRKWSSLSVLNQSPEGRPEKVTKGAPESSQAVTRILDYLPRVAGHFKLGRKSKTDVEQATAGSPEKGSSSSDGDQTILMAGRVKEPDRSESKTDKEAVTEPVEQSSSSGHSSPTKGIPNPARKVMFDLGQGDPRPAGATSSEKVAASSGPGSGGVATKAATKRQDELTEEDAMTQAKRYLSDEESRHKSGPGRRHGHGRHFSFTPGDDDNSFSTRPMPYAVSMGMQPSGVFERRDPIIGVRAKNEVLADGLGMASMGANEDTTEVATAVKVVRNKTARRASSRSQFHSLQSQGGPVTAGDPTIGMIADQHDDGESSLLSQTAQAHDVIFSSVAAARPATKTSSRIFT